MFICYNPTFIINHVSNFNYHLVVKMSFYNNNNKILFRFKFHVLIVIVIPNTFIKNPKF